MSEHSSFDVLVVGAGPVGLMGALLLARRKVNVAVIEASSQLSDTPRAIVYLPQTIGTLEDAGILDQVKDEGLLVHRPPCWRTTSDMKKHAEFDFSTLKDNDLPLPKHRMAILMGQQVLGRIILERLKALNVPVLFDKAISDITQDSSGVTVTATHTGSLNEPNGPRQFKAAYLLASDGGRSYVRQHFAIPFEGYTHNMTFMSINLRYPAAESYDLNDANFLVHPTSDGPAESDFGVFIRTGKDGIWRCAYGDDPSLSTEELLSRVHLKLKRMLPGHPDKDAYEVLLSAPYKVHQRAAATFVEGRVLLSGDSAHLNNPIGGLGLCTGLLDVHAAAVALTAILRDGANAETQLSEYNTNRRRAFLGTTNPMSTENLRRLREKSEEADRELREDFFRKMNNDREFHRQVMLAMNGIATGVPGFEAVTRQEQEKVSA